ncbi:MAG TPA: ribosome maturation factor RimM [Acidimicrobiales bacterium]|nr:ribosome maturation factor RimM [Acidimicrobiales bacterium]
MPEAHDLLEVGHIAKPHGLRGEVVVDLVTTRTERLAVGSQLVVAGADGATRTLVVAGSKPLQHRYIVAFEGVSSREEADRLHGAKLLAEPIDDVDGYFVHELIGSEVFEAGGERRGVVTAIEANPASDLLVIDERWYVPLRFAVERSPGRIVVDVPAGMFDE